MNSWLEKIQPQKDAPLIADLNDGNLCRSGAIDTVSSDQSSHDLRKITNRQSGQPTSAAEQSTLRTEELRFPRALEDEAPTEKKSDQRRPTTSSRWKLLYGIQGLLRPVEEADGTRKRGPAVCGCGFSSLANDDVTLHVKRVGPRATPYVTGVYRCGSPWLCPVCSAKAATVRQRRVQKVAEATLERGGLFCHVVITVRHTRGEALADLKTAVSQANRAARQGRAWNLIKATTKAVGVLSAPEVTFSPKNGWHYHIHQAIPMLISDEAVARDGCRKFVDRYLAELKKRGFDANWNGQHVNVSHDAISAAAYVGKGLSWEIAGGASTKTRTRAKDSLSPFQIAQLAAEGSEKMRLLWIDYAATMAGTRSCVITPAIAKALGTNDVEGDGEQGDEEEGEQQVDVVGTLPTTNWNCLVRKGHAPTLFEKLETLDASAWPIIRRWAMDVTTLLRACDIPIDPADLKVSTLVRSPLSRSEVVRTIAWRGRSFINGRRYIEEEVARIQRDSERFCNPKAAISIAEVAACLVSDVKNDHHSPP